MVRAVATTVDFFAGFVIVFPPWSIAVRMLCVVGMGGSAGVLLGYNCGLFGGVNRNLIFRGLGNVCELFYCLRRGTITMFVT